MMLLLQYTLIFTSVLMLVALGGCFSEHSGVINIGLEGIMVFGALGGALVMKYMPANTAPLVMIVVVVCAAMLAGILYSLLLAVAAINFKADQTLVGTAMNLLGTAAATVIVKAINTAADSSNTSSEIMYVGPKKAFIIVEGTEFSWFMLLALVLLIGLRRASPGGGLRGHQRLPDALRRRDDLRPAGRLGRPGVYHRGRQRVEV